MQKFDSLLSQVIKILEKYGPRQSEKAMEELWLNAVLGMFQIKSRVLAADDRSDNSERLEEECCFGYFMLIRTQHFMLKMSEHVHLIQVIKFLESKGFSLTFEDFKLVFQDKI
jgi:hypothetical protein